MGQILARTTSFDLDLTTRPGESVLEALRRTKLPAGGFLLYDTEDRFVSLTRVLGEDESVRAYAIRNPDYSILRPGVQVAASGQPVAEIFAAAPDQTTTLLQFNRKEGIDYIYAGVAEVLDRYRAERFHGSDSEIQVALSGGGDGRIVGECIGRYQAEHPEVRFHAIITANGFEDETDHLDAATGIAKRFDIPFTAYNEAESAKVLGFERGFNDALNRYRNEFPHDEAEILATYWVQELNLKVAEKAGRPAIVFGFNQEDVIAEVLYQALTGAKLPRYPVRNAAGVDILAPLYKIPKRLIDALDQANSMRNYDRRQPSVSYLRSAAYFTAYYLMETFPALAEAYADPTILGSANDERDLAWLHPGQ